VFHAGDCGVTARCGTPCSRRTTSTQRADAEGVQVLQASWKDVVAALELEAKLLGDGTAWELSRVQEWWDAGVETAVVVKDGTALVSYACAMTLSPAAFDAIVSGSLNPEHLELAHTDVRGSHHWVGIVVTDEAYRGRGAGRLVLEALTNQLSGSFVADVYTEAGRVLLERLGWKQVLDAQHPIYVLAKS
jgi:hypothetical protein